MSLEARLRGASADAFPETPDLAAAWSAGTPPYGDGTAQRWRPRGLALALAALLVPAGAFAAFELLGPPSVKIVRVEELAPAPPPAPGDLGQRVSTLAQAEDRAGFAIHEPPYLDSDPTAIYVNAGVVTLTYADVTVTELRASTTEALITKTTGRGTKVEVVDVEGAPAYFFSGAPHNVLVERGGKIEKLPERRAGNTLVYERDGIVIRVEGLTAPPPSP